MRGQIELKDFEGALKNTRENLELFHSRLAANEEHKKLEENFLNSLCFAPLDFIGSQFRLFRTNQRIFSLKSSIDQAENEIAELKPYIEKMEKSKKQLSF